MSWHVVIGTPDMSKLILPIGAVEWRVRLFEDEVGIVFVKYPHRVEKRVLEVCATTGDMRPGALLAVGERGWACGILVVWDDETMMRGPGCQTVCSKCGWHSTLFSSPLPLLMKHHPFGLSCPNYCSPLSAGWREVPEGCLATWGDDRQVKVPSSLLERAFTMKSGSADVSPSWWLDIMKKPVPDGFLEVFKNEMLNIF